MAQKQLRPNRVIWAAAGFLAFAAMNSTMAVADPSYSLADYLGEEMELLDASVTSCAADFRPDQQPASEETWFFRRFWLRVRPRASFGVAGVAKVEIVPEVELLWERPLPVGWSNYKP